MVRRWLRGAAALLVCLPFATFASGTPATAAAPTVVLTVDARDVTRGVLHVHETIAVTPGPLTLAYPEWIPGEHGPNGPLVNLTGLDVRAGGAPVTWRRDLDDLYAVHLTVPAGATSLDVRYDFLGASTGKYSSARLFSADAMVLTWNKVIVAPAVADYRRITIAPGIRLPSNWSYATALDTLAQRGADVTFAPVTMEQLVDSPLDAGTVMRRWSLGSIDGAPVDLAAFADTPEELDVKPALLAKFRNLVSEMGALYCARHFRHYTFLLTVSDVLGFEGVEHHQSSDDGVSGDFFLDDASLVSQADLLPHEFNHSWDGKYRRPADLATPNLHVPMRDDLLWVYEGMTQYYGDVQAARSGLLTPALWRSALAATYAFLDSETGRRVRPLQDTADMAAVLYDDVPAFGAARRSVDFYPEGELMWLEADGIIRRGTGGRRSLDDLARTFFGRTSSGPQVVTYTRRDIVAALQAVYPYDWAGFFAQRIDAIAPHPPNPFVASGWRVVFRPVRSEYERDLEQAQKSFSARYSLGIEGKDSGEISDVIDASVAAAAGIAPGAKIIAVDDRPVDTSVRALLDPALVRAARDRTPVRLLLLQGGTYRTVPLAYTGGPRYPDLVRASNRPDTLDQAAQPRRATKHS